VKFLYSVFSIPYLITKKYSHSFMYVQLWLAGKSQFILFHWIHKPHRVHQFNKIDVVHVYSKTLIIHVSLHCNMQLWFYSQGLSCGFRRLSCTPPWPGCFMDTTSDETHFLAALLWYLFFYFPCFTELILFSFVVAWLEARKNMRFNYGMCRKYSMWSWLHFRDWTTRASCLQRMRTTYFA
jgi:hypothetical protein